MPTVRRPRGPASSPAPLRVWLSLALLACGLAAAEGARAPALRILARFPVSSAPSTAMDVRWASPGSVYLARLIDGVTEVGLGDQLARRRGLVPAKRYFRFENFTSLAVSQGALVVASQDHSLAWRSLAASPDRTTEFRRWPAGSVGDLDVSGDRVLLLGYPRATVPKQFHDIAWIGTLANRLADLRPLLADVSGDGARAFDNCIGTQVGAVRFLGDGSFLVAPGTQPGVHLYRPDGTLARTWDAGGLGIDTAADCAAMSAGERARLYGDPQRRLAWVNRHRVLDEILPLPRGPGLLVRSWEGGRAHWDLEILDRTTREVESLAVPLTSAEPGDRLRGDVRDGRIVLLRSARAGYAAGKAAPSTGELVIAELP
jgi:hypothetical protein